ncbi:MAG: UDP-2,3-diacylglucosamine diphosphatase LpxI [Myxococcota bacterium]|jgi:hypothetical protein|nr:UDP-2,3-diacylglucosamine diphosphatase LpxI [Myxococcota bacterium]
MTETIGLIAGNGTFPILFARAARQKGVHVVAVAMQGETLEDINAEVDEITWVRVGQVGKTISTFKKANITQAAMAGGVRKTRLFEGARPDMTGLKLLAKNLTRPDDGMLRTFAKAFEDEGIEIVDSTLYMPEALAPHGVLSQREPTQDEWRDLEYGYNIACQMGKLDVGQTVIVKSGAVVALEAIEGTDACIKRAGELTKNKGAVMVKIAKPDQDMRFDVPAIGLETLKSLESAGIKVLGIDAGRTLMLDKDELLKRAERMKIAVVGLNTDLLNTKVQT